MPTTQASSEGLKCHSPPPDRQTAPLTQHAEADPSQGIAQQNPLKLGAHCTLTEAPQCISDLPEHKGVFDACGTLSVIKAASNLHLAKSHENIQILLLVQILLIQVLLLIQILPSKGIHKEKHIF